MTLAYYATAIFKKPVQNQNKIAPHKTILSTLPQNRPQAPRLKLPKAPNQSPVINHQAPDISEKHQKKTIF